MVGGVAIFDFDGDGYADLYFVNGADMPSLEKTGPKYKNRLFRNNHDLTFTDVTDKAGVGGSGYGMGVAVGDYDNDGRPDLFVTSVNENQLFHNNGDGTFTDVTAKAGVSGGLFAGKKMWSVGAAWVDYNNDGLLDLFVANYCQWDPNNGGRHVALTEIACSAIRGCTSLCPIRFIGTMATAPSPMYRSKPASPRIQAEGWAWPWPISMATAFPDIFVANDDFPNQLFHNVGGKRFEEVADEAGVSLT